LEIVSDISAVASSAGYTDLVYHWTHFPVKEGGRNAIDFTTMVLRDMPLPDDMKRYFSDNMRLTSTQQFGSGIYVSRSQTKWEGYAQTGDKTAVFNGEVPDDIIEYVLSCPFCREYFNIDGSIVRSKDERYRRNMTSTKVKKKIWGIGSSISWKNEKPKLYKFYYNPNNLTTVQGYYEASELSDVPDIESLADGEIVVRDIRSLKSADETTYDNKGIAIDLSERFNSGIADVRY